MNILSQSHDDLVPVDYGDLLNQILRVLRSQNPFRLSSQRDRLLIECDLLAAQVASLQVQDPLSSNQGVRSASIYFSSSFAERFPHQIREIRDCLQELLESTVGENTTLSEFFASLITPLEHFNGKSNQLGFTYDFNRFSLPLEKQKLTLESNRPGSDSILKFHKLTITVQKVDLFRDRLQNGLKNYIDSKGGWETEEERDGLYDSLDSLVENESSDFYRLQQVVDTQALGKLKKEAKIRYLEYLKDCIEATDNRRFYLEDLIRRLRRIESYISNVERADDDYTVTYAGVKVNYRELFARAEVLDALPIIPIVTGNLGETTDMSRGDRQFVFGLKMKFGNRVQARGGEEVFEYNLKLLNPDSEEHQQELERNPNFGIKVLKLAFLYYFIFASRFDPESPDYQPSSELSYDPVHGFDEKVLPILKGEDEERKRTLFRSFLAGFEKFKIRNKISNLKELLKDFLKKAAILQPRVFPIQISVRRGILEQDVNNLFNGIFFNEVLGRNPKECLRYISIGEASIDENALCQLSASIAIEDIRYFPTEERQQISIEYDIKGMMALPIMWVPESCMEVYLKRFSQQKKLLLFRYNNRRLDANSFDSTQAFVYRFTLELLAYVFLKILTKNLPNHVFIPMVRLHEGTHEHPSPSEEFVAGVSKVLSHLLNETHRCSSQGFRIHNQNSYKVQNGLSSLYSILPKKFTLIERSSFPTLKKLAIIIVSSLESDARTGSGKPRNRLSNLLGEVVSVTQKADAIRVEILKTFSDNYQNQRLYSEPPVLRDLVNNLYDQGYRHFLYIAQAPYSSTLHITRNDENEGLYFMSPTLIRSLTLGKSDLKIYPIFFDQYYVRKCVPLKASSFYIQNPNQLMNLMEDRSHKAVVFFNLFNGINVGHGDERFYNGVISYSTLLNIYPGVLDDLDIRRGLLEQDSPLKDDLLQYLTLFHFYRCEKNSNVHLKLDPYENIIGDESLGKLSVFNHMRGAVNFNSLAFLTEVNKVLNV